VKTGDKKREVFDRESRNRLQVERDAAAFEGGQKKKKKSTRREPSPRGIFEKAKWTALRTHPSQRKGARRERTRRMRKREKGRGSAFAGNRELLSLLQVEVGGKGSFKGGFERIQEG